MIKFLYLIITVEAVLLIFLLGIMEHVLLKSWIVCAMSLFCIWVWLNINSIGICSLKISVGRKWYSTWCIVTLKDKSAHVCICSSVETLLFLCGLAKKLISDLKDLCGAHCNWLWLNLLEITDCITWFTAWQITCGNSAILGRSDTVIYFQVEKSENLVWLTRQKRVVAW